MNKNNLATFTRYISLFMIIINIMTYNNISNISFFLSLIFIINNQIRFFNFNNKNLPMIISSLLEFILILALYNYTYKFTPFYFLPLIIDICFSKIIKNKYLYLIILIGSYFIINFNNSIYSSIEYSLILSLISLLYLYIYNEDIFKINIQNVYDKLRISEDKLKKSNSDLEVYISSVEELAILKERNRISREIHDSVGHSLSTTIIQLGAIENLVSKDEDLKELVHELREFVKESFKEVREAVTSLKPEGYENYQNLFKIEELIRNFIKMTNIDVKMTVSKNTWNLSSVQCTALYRIIQESLSNSIRHGKATKVNIFITFNSNNLILSIKDNGIGCKDIKKGNGLNSIKERVDELNGKVEFITSNDGFIIHTSFPKNTRSEFVE
ncbi:sensor histidine kinase [[Clostridium] dakarense]|uniref:sensor histidine kinase n=1 Tax=Faecalimicrobium dakarense TaxID=1301100 RepID=UPI0004ACB0B7|nr:sensor histidine kinase [[Clostridium] dakarense]